MRPDSQLGLVDVRQEPGDQRPADSLAPVIRVNDELCGTSCLVQLCVPDDAAVPAED